MTEYQFTQDWFHWAPGLWEQLIPMLPAHKKFLEIGSYEGRSMAWIVEHMLGDSGELVCIDTWEGGEEHDDVSGVEARFDHNREVAMRAKGWDVEDQFGPKSVAKLKGTSVAKLAELIAEGDGGFDFIYIDGSHIAKDVLTDACMAWPLLNPLGIMVFDDYTWGETRDILHRPKLAVDSFVNIFAEELEVIHMGYQLALRKRG